MSLVRNQIRVFESQQNGRRRARHHTRELWSDSAQRRFESQVLDELELHDRSFAEALNQLDSAFDEAKKLLGPI